MSSPPQSARRRALLALAGGAAAAVFVSTPRAQQPFIELRPPLPALPGRIEVVEFFWYECPHCYELEPHVERWVPRLAPDVEFRRVPAPLNERWRIAARVYYALESLGIVAQHHGALFDAIHRDRLRVTDERQLGDWLARRGVEPARFQAAARSFAVENRLARAADLARAARIDAVPSMLVHGRYVASASAAGSVQRLLVVADALIERARIARE
jgi:thiol:disulfide interchange protein DsbA